jgi:putative membrane protein
VHHPEILVLLAAVAALYGRGYRRVGGSNRSVPWLLGAGLLSIALVLSSPLDGAAERGLTAHMVQHVVLMVVSAPLLVAAAPMPALLAATPQRWQLALASLRVRGSWVVWAAVGLILSAVAMWGWHAPVLYEAALRHQPLHALEHGSYLATAAVFWQAVGLGHDPRHGGVVPVLFVAALPGTALGAALTLATHAWYPSYPSLDDQQMAGIVMWGFGGLAYVVAAAVLFGTWLAATDRATPPRPLATGART